MTEKQSFSIKENEVGYINGKASSSGFYPLNLVCFSNSHDLVVHRVCSPLYYRPRFISAMTQLHVRFWQLAVQEWHSSVPHCSKINNI